MVNGGPGMDEEEEERDAYAIDWDIQVEGHAWRGGKGLIRLDGAPEKMEMMGGKLYWEDYERLYVLGMLLENVGIKDAMRLAPLDRWRTALEELEAEAHAI